MRSSLRTLSIIGLMFLSVAVAQAAAPTVSSTSPAKNAFSVSASSNITVTFNQSMNTGTLTTSTIKVYGSIRGFYSGAVNTTSTTATFDPDLTFKSGEVITVMITTGVQNASNEPMAKGYVYTFTVDPSAGGSTLATKVHVAAGDGPEQVVSADVDNDGDIDLVAANYGSSNISVLLNNGDGTFASAVNYSRGGSSWTGSVAVADVDGNGYVDLIGINNTFTTAVAVLLDNADGTFASAVYYSTGGSGFVPDRVITTDVDGDADMDIITVSSTGDNFSVLKNNGDGTFGSLAAYGVGDQPVDIIAADLESDGDMDLVTVNMNANTLSVMLNNGSGSFALNNTPNVGSSPRRVVAIDKNGDGSMDLAVTNHNANTIYVMDNYLSNGTAFSLGGTLSPGNFPYGISAVDIDSDGDMDLISTLLGSYQVSVQLNNGSGGFASPVKYYTGTDPRSIITADLNGDGGVDVVTANWSADSLSVLSIQVPPSATTSAATSIGTTSATLNGSVTAYNYSTATKFAYKLSSSGTYADTIAATPSSASGISATTISANLTGLVPNSTYDFKAVGISSVGTGVGSALQFSTLAAPPSITTNAATSVTGTTVTLNGTVNPQNSETYRKFLYGTASGVYTDSTSAWPEPAGTSAVPFTWNLTGLIGGTTYYFKAVATNDGGRSEGSELNFTTSQYDPAISSKSPAANALNVSASSNIVITFNTAMDNAAVASGLTVSGSQSGIHQGSLTHSGTVYTFDPSSNFYAGEVVTVTLTTGVENNANTPLTNPVLWSFTVQSATSINAFSSPVYYDLGAYVQKTPAVGDVDGDGDMDLVAAVYNGGTVAVLKNNGDGTFASATTFSAQTNPNTTALADVDRDGDLDVMASNRGSNSVSVLLNGGTGTLGTAVNYSVQSQPSRVRPADVNGDGYVDLVVTHEGSVDVSVLMNNGDGTFAASVQYAGGGQYSSLRTVFAGDIDNDGDLDLVSTNMGTSNVSVLKNNGNGTFASYVEYSVGTYVENMVLADGNGDGDLDAITAHIFSNDITVLPNNGSGTFGTSVVYNKGGYSTGGLAGGDVDGDGDIDLIGTDGGWDQFMKLLLNNGDGTYAAAVSIGYRGSGDADMADLNGDGKLDLLYTYNSNQVYVALNAPAPTISSITPAMNALNVAKSANIDITFSLAMNTGTVSTSNIKVHGSKSGGHSGSVSHYNSNQSVTFNPTEDFTPGEVVTVVITTGVQSSDNVSLARSYSRSFTVDVTGADVLTPAVTYSAGTNPHSVAIAKINSYGYLDIAAANSGSNNYSVLMNNYGSIAAATNYTVGTSPYGIIAADMDGDGDVDLTAVNNGDDNVTVTLNDGNGSYSSNGNFSAGTTPRGGTAADIDGDGDMDIITANGGSNNVSVLFNNGSGSLAAAINYSVGTTPMGVSAADVDGDGDIDLVAANSGSNNVSVLLNTGSATFNAAVHYNAGTGPFAVTTADVDADGDADVVVSNNGSDNVSVLLNTGSGSLASAVNYSVGTSPRGLSVGDIDGDNDLDLYVANSGSNDVSVLKNNGNGTFAASQQYVVGTSPYDVGVGDLDEDGDLDVIAVNNGSGNVSVLRNFAQPTTTASSLYMNNNYGAQVKLNWSNGNGGSRIVVVKQGSAVDGIPVDNTQYTANNVFGSGSEIGTGNYVVYNGTGNSVIIKGLSTNTQYTATVFEYNSSGSIVLYGDAASEVSVTTNATAAIPFDTVAGYAMNYDGRWNATNSSFTLGTSFSVEFWAKPTSLLDSMIILVHGNDQMWIGLNAAGKFTGMVYDENASASMSIVGTTTAVADKWYHLALTAANGSPMKLYVNGVLEATSGGNVGTISTASGVLYPGGDYNNDSYRGHIDELRLWDDIRSEQELREYMHRPLSGIPANLVNYWQFNEGSGSTSAELVGDNHMYDGLLWVTSGAPVGGGTVSNTSVAASNNGPHTIGNATLTMTNGFDNPVDVYVSELTADPSNYPAGYSSSVGSKYFVINLFGDPGTFSTSLTLTFGPGAITTAQHNDPGLLSLYKRESNSSGTWTLIANATSADSVTGQVTWAGITSFSQFLAVSEDNETPPSLTVTKADFADWMLPENQDRITDNVWLTREDYGVLFNIKTESSYNSNSSPAGTEWAVGKISDGIETLTFDTFRNLRDGTGMGGDLTNLPGKDVVLHLIAEDIYLDVHFNSWSSGGDGGFSYTRSLKPLELIQTGYSNLAATSVTVSGQIHSKTTTAAAYLLYGTASGVYTDSVLLTPSTIPADTVYSISKSLTGLTEGTTYYYRFAASNGTIYARSGERSVRPHTIQYWNKNNGTVTFTKADYADWNDAVNQDRISSDVWITRKDDRGIFNIKTESSYDDDISPEGTEWAVGTINDGVENLTFNSWYNTQQSLGSPDGAMLKGGVEVSAAAGPPDMVNVDMVLHLIEEDIYIDIKFTSWTSGGAGGGFSYQRGSAPLYGMATHATGIGSSGATVHGSVYSTGYNATAKFFYGTSSGVYTDSIVTTPSSITMNTATSVSADLTGLTSGVLYYVKLKSQNDTMSNRSSEMTVMTMSSSQASALRFDGSDDHVRIADANAFDMTDTYTLEAWIKPNGFSSMAGIISKYHSGGSNGYFIRLSNDPPYTGIRFDEHETASGILTAGTWYHIAAVNDNGTRTLYVNGSPVSISGEGYTTNSNSDHIAIGSDFGGRYFNGTIDEVRIWNVARTQQQIQDNMNLPFTSAQSGLVGYWQLNAGSGTVAHSHGSGGGDGQLMNFNFTGSSGWVSSDAPLPVELSSFTAVSQRLETELKWSTVTENNNYGYEIERTAVTGEKGAPVTAERNWTKVGFVEGRGTSNSPSEYSFTDKVGKAGKYSYRLKQVDRDGKFVYSQEVEVEVGSVPKVFALQQNYPNPFNPATMIEFTLDMNGLTTLKIYDIVGREVATLVNNELLEAGVYHQKQFDARHLASGVYFARLVSGSKVQVKKLMLMK